ncbi:MAG: tripartite tricarboxylate transporter TctB family protein [Paracoccaceae bacterium]|nr:tripartite tricarboxylate transporter TctB family protein [Paracoccaceae bacterium]
MALDRWIAFVILLICLCYGYQAYFVMDFGLPPFMKRNPIWPSTFPKLLSVMGIVLAITILLGFEKHKSTVAESEINYRRLGHYKLGQALALLALMVTYALFLRPAGFLLSTTGFLVIGATVLGERKFQILVPVSVLAAGSIWYLVQVILGIFLRPWPFFIGIG